ncbi:organic solute transporter Ostalpha-domain-containing protein [Lentinula raphanica]|uniref:Organic solute transporter Ostalpha-domain-containing protein n=1 Tax=Lentinula raphanica TaxID=153919 RepID=A0AA38P4F1_9AGAR|nr:DUF300-domain-containing protein [Lentinula raphanica]KAJ3819226.1 organic solute transporter Ostalpha-domain-containing protein [Lentinula raphanica]KAJ3835873.1 organic solute transporter Ostalpha-domain-containing protein [Lentinula raphanica]
MPTCPSDNQQSVDQTDFWTDGGINWDAHRIGWAIAGACAAATVIISFFSVLQHCRSYTNPAEQRQILRILYMPPVYGVISFLSYRFFRSYTYYELVEVVYEAFTLSAFLMLLIEFVAATGSGHKAESSIARKDKRKLPFPFCHWRYRPTKPYFMYTLKWAVLQYVIFRPAISIAAIICQAYNVLCESEGFDARYANVYLEAVDFVSISVALYGLFLFYGLTKEELAGRRPLAKFLAIKLIVMFTWYQSFVFDALEGRVIHATEYWTETNIADGLNALAICIEMIFFACFMWWAYTPAAYRIEGAKPTSIWRPLWDSINFSDFALEIWTSLRFFLAYIRGVPETRSRYANQVTGFDEAFGLEKPRHTVAYGENNSSESVMRGQGYNSRTSEYDSSRAPRMSYDEDIRLAPYSYGDSRDDHETSSPLDDHVHEYSDGSHTRS